MELTGEEKRIQALFSQLRIEDEFVAPRFTAPVIRVNSVTKRRPLNFSFAAILLSAITVVAWWGSGRLQHRTSSSVSSVVAPALAVIAQSGGEGEIASATASPVFKRKRTAVGRPQFLSQRLLARRSAAVAAAHQQMMDNAKAISNWESPTSSLLDSASSEVLTTLPQLNENASQLKSFLPNGFN